METVTGNPYFFRLVWQWRELPHPDSTFCKGRCSLMLGAHLANPTQKGEEEGRGAAVGGGGGSKWNLRC